MEVKSYYRNMRIKYKVITLISIVMVIVGGVTYVAQQFISKAYDEEIYSQSASALNSASLGIENELKKLEKLSFSIATDSSIQSYLDQIKKGGTEYDYFVTANALRQRMVSLGALEKYVLSVQIIDAYGKDYATGRQSINFSSKRKESIIADTAVNQGGVSFVSPGDSDPALIVGREIRAVQNLDLNHLGAIAVRIDLNRLFQDYAKGLDNEGANFAILDGSQSVYPSKPSIDVSQIGLDLTGKRGYRIVSTEGKKVFMAFIPSGYTHWTYLNIIPFNDIFRGIESAKRTVLIIYAIMGVVVILVALGFSRGITGPIERLSARMKRVQLGHFDYSEDQGEPALSKDEAGQLQRNFRIMVQRIEELINENYVKQLAIKDTKFKALQAQINPHFLYNTLESINWSAKMNGQQQISQMVESLGSLLRSSISLKQPLIPLSQELDMINHYIRIQKIRFEERLDFQMEVPAELLNCLIPKLSLQPLVENAVNYGVEQMIEPCTIRVTARIEDEQLLIAVEDNGPGMEYVSMASLDNDEVKPRGSGLGLKNIEERIKLLFGESHGLRIESERHVGTSVTLHLPYEMREEDV